MTDEHNQAVAQWLEAEAAGRWDEAEALVGAVIASNLPRLAPAPGLADRVGSRLGWPLAAPIVRPLPGWARAAALVAIILGGVAGAAFASIPTLEVLRAAWVLGSKAVAMGWLLSSMVLAAAWQVLSHTLAIARALALVVSSGPGGALLLANLVLAAAASIALKRTMSPEEERS